MTASTDDPLPSWRPGAAKTALLDFLDAAREVPVAERVAMFDNDGTLWCEKPQYLQLLFMLDQLQRAAAADPSIATRPEFRALIERDHAAQAELGLERIALALVQLTIGLGPRGVRRPRSRRSSPRRSTRHDAYRCSNCDISRCWS